MAKDDIGELLNKWEETYKKGLLSFWILLLLYERPSYPYEMSAEVAKISQGTISVDDNSIYRALNRFEAVGIVKSELQQSSTGPQRRYYDLTNTGKALLSEFIKRNIQVFETPVVSERIAAVLKNSSHAK
ncbi:MAG TPA: PadR family transcriptional regulator [Anaerolineales bacterium]|nr:PadR family transcriptional regulator [Anaerolineales bacterium]HLO28723.1 PadR family transcriptional regulator [Anaerolineales bacterium]